MSRLVYACRFDVAAGVAPDFILRAYREWIERHYTKKLNLQNFAFNFPGDGSCSTDIPQNHKIVVSQFSAKDEAVHQISWRYPSDYDATLLWRNEIRIGSFSDAVSLEHSIWIESMDFRVAPARVDMGAPRAIRRICTEHTVHVGDMVIRATPYLVKFEGVNQFLTLLRSDLRRLPIVFLSPYTSNDKNLIDIPALAEKLAGVAVVVEAESADVTWEIADALGRSLSCFDGAARIYWPGFSGDDEPRRHPLYLATRIEAAKPHITALEIQRTIFSVASFRFVPDPRINAVIRYVESLQRIERIEEQKADAGTNWEQYALELDNELSSVKNRLNEIEAENENLKANQKVIFSVQDEDDPENLTTYAARSPTSNREAVEFAQADFKNLIILDSATDSASESPFRRPEEIYEALSDLNEISHEWHKQRQETGAGGDLRQHLIKKGWGKRCSLSISDTTKRKYGSDYTFQYENKRQFFEPHITLGSGDANSCASIHFIADHTKGKIVVAYVGRHLRNTKT